MTKKSILLVEDDYLDVMSVQRMLSKLNANHDLYVAHNGVDALEYLNGSERREKILPDTILLDLNMPKMNGLEFLRIVRNYCSLKDIKIVVMTTSDDEYDVVATQQLGASGYIIKPLNFDSGKGAEQPAVAELRRELLGHRYEVSGGRAAGLLSWLPASGQVFKKHKKQDGILTLTQ